MCLIIKENQEAKRAKKDITVYKIVEQGEKGILSTPFQHVTIAIGKKYETSEQFKVESDESNCNHEEDEKVVGKGLFHSYPTYKDAEDSLKFMQSVHTTLKFGIAKCIIPKGSWYLEGTTAIYRTCVFFTVAEIHTASVGSTAIKYVEMLDEPKTFSERNKS